MVGTKPIGFEPRELDYTSPREAYMPSHTTRDEDRRFMAQAVELADLCVAEDERAPRPKVAAVIAENGQSEATFRGSNSAGDHAEYTLLYKKLTWRPTNATLYTTLEPCVTR